MKTRALCLAVVSALTIAACGGDDEDTTAPAPAGASSGSETLELTAGEPGPEEFTFDPGDLDAKAGSVTIDLELPDGLKAPHGISLEGDGVDESGEVVQAGSTSSITVDLKPGEYTFYCPVGDHRDEGMEGTLTVE